MREAKKRSPETIGILLAGEADGDVEALVGAKEVFQVVRGGVTPESIRKLIDNATQQARLIALAESAKKPALAWSARAKRWMPCSHATRKQGTARACRAA